jgi:hypothetical protein
MSCWKWALVDITLDFLSIPPVIKSDPLTVFCHNLLENTKVSHGHLFMPSFWTICLFSDQKIHRQETQNRFLITTDRKHRTGFWSPPGLGWFSAGKFLLTPSSRRLLPHSKLKLNWPGLRSVDIARCTPYCTAHRTITRWFIIWLNKHNIPFLGARATLEYHFCFSYYLGASFFGAPKMDIFGLQIGRIRARVVGAYNMAPAL